MEELLKSWNLEELVPRLYELGIADTESLLLLNEAEHGNFLFQNNELGLKLKLFRRIQNHNQASNPPVVLAVGSESECVNVSVDLSAYEDSLHNSSASSSSSKRSVSPSPDAFDYNPASKKPRSTLKVGRRALENLDIISVLTEDSENGIALLEYFKCHKTFSKRHRDILAATVITAARKISDYLKNEDFELLSKKIEEAFPGELASIYYLAPFSEGQSQTISKAKLPTRYRNVLKKERELAGGGSARPSTSRQRQNFSNPYDNVTAVVITSDIREAYLWLENNLVLDDWPLLKAKWRLSAPLRLRNLFNDKSDSPIFNYIQKWPCLKHPSGYTLLELDFDVIYPDKEVSLFEKWDVFVSKILALASKGLHDSVAKDCLALAKNVTHPGSKGVLALNILPALCPPTTKIKGAKAAEQRRLLVSNSRAGLMLHVTDTANISRGLRERRESLIANDKKSQPFLVFVGPKLSNIKEYYVDVSGILYRVNSVVKAVDVCFKATTALHANYPTESQRVWVLIQRLLYDISTAWDSGVPYDIIASYNAISL
ncbi:Spore wall protein 3 [Frankliniella fusca]|uniref:Spore wall protein 3 n=1 Tax=Frankliniella fusca TaxID=407009 RepID=A0AAE1H6U5_9NEOP|nr:Spore wall protein 3 [Frankliniella fusca]